MARRRPGLETLISLIRPDNVRSRRVATKLGMTIESQIHNPVTNRAADIWGCHSAVTR